MEKKLRKIFDEANKLFIDKSADYGMSWRLLRPLSMNDQLEIKVKRLRTIQNPEYTAQVDESQYEGFQALFNYSIMAIINLREGYTNGNDGMVEKYILDSYQLISYDCQTLLNKKNADYGEAWKDLSVESITDLIFQKILRAKQIIGNGYNVKASEGIEGSYMDIVNYSVFAMYHIGNSYDKLKEITNNRIFGGLKERIDHIFDSRYINSGYSLNKPLLATVEEATHGTISDIKKRSLINQESFKKAIQSKNTEKQKSIESNYGKVTTHPYFTVQFITLDELEKLTK